MKLHLKPIEYFILGVIGAFFLGGMTVDLIYFPSKVNTVSYIFFGGGAVWLLTILILEIMIRSGDIDAS